MGRRCRPRWRGLAEEDCILSRRRATTSDQLAGVGRLVSWTYVVFACFLTVENLGTLNDALRRNMLVTLLRLYKLLATIG
jgi:hypothetical protein